jgi:hypothetical protein
MIREELPMTSVQAVSFTPDSLQEEPLAIHGCVRVFALPSHHAMPGSMRSQSEMVRVTTSTELAEALNDLRPRKVLVPRGANITSRDLRIVANRFSVEHTVFLE